MPSPRSIALVVEGNYLVASVIETPLVEHGFQVLIATSDEEARQLLAKHPAQVAIIDFPLQHGRHDGLVSLLEEHGIPYVFCTASTSEEVAEHFPGARVIEKPFSDEKLLSVVASLRTSGQEQA